MSQESIDEKSVVNNIVNDLACDLGQKLISLDKALAELKSCAVTIQKTETVTLKESLGRILAEDLISTINVPPTDNSAMDGYAIHTDSFDNRKNHFDVSQRICAGETGERLSPNTTARIFTGASIPEGANAVIMQENCEYHPSTETVTIKQVVKSGTNIRKAGEDIHSGDVVLKQGQKLRAQDIGLTASIGVAELIVKQRLKVAVFFTGDELCNPGEPIEVGQIYNSNRYTLTSLLKSIGCEVIDLGIVEDSLESTVKALQHAADKADLVMTSGGVSVGEEDHIRKALEQLGQISMWRVNIKPGKPFVYGEINSQKQGGQKRVPFIGLPGNPVSVFVTYCIFAHPFILKSQGVNDVETKSFKIPSGFDLNANQNRNEYIRVRMELDDSGQSSLSLYPHQGSGVLSSASWANGLVFIPVKTQIKVGDMLEFTPFSEFCVG